jgi:hypothetical protein
MMSQEAQKGSPRRGRALQTIRFCVESAVSDGNIASIRLRYREGTVPGFSSFISGNSTFKRGKTDLRFVTGDEALD